jgi:hypothetical protein
MPQVVELRITKNELFILLFEDQNSGFKECFILLQYIMRTIYVLQFTLINPQFNFLHLTL